MHDPYLLKKFSTWPRIIHSNNVTNAFPQLDLFPHRPHRPHRPPQPNLPTIKLENRDRYPTLEPQKKTHPHRPLPHRPISLHSSIGKVLQKINNRRLSRYLESSNCSSLAQYGCSRGRSPTMALADWDIQIQNTRKNKATLYSGFLDFQNSYPTAGKDHICRILKVLWLSRPLLCLLQCYLYKLCI